ncbi:hypothetical protein BUALT_BualtUnG0016600 [Buddleja alternifolia]|uniref:Uncharacterized protein n=1 Tax=Buddleja alternifolia TaxID=168488 RepID=A0AAV6W0K4_9LAMI|nr:hypothetical protein BUALT_BualtUnG0016600 [Buddleja alternifolia]
MNGDVDDEDENVEDEDEDDETLGDAILNTLQHLRAKCKICGHPPDTTILLFVSSGIAQGRKIIWKQLVLSHHQELDWVDWNIRATTSRYTCGDWDITYTETINLLWQEMNVAIQSRRCPLPYVTLAAIRHRVEEEHKMASDDPKAVEKLVQRGWQCPTEGLWKLNVDAVVRGWWTIRWEERDRLTRDTHDGWVRGFSSSAATNTALGAELLANSKA